jgi:hypothetical protein
MNKLFLFSILSAGITLAVRFTQVIQMGYIETHGFTETIAMLAYMFGPYAMILLLYAFVRIEGKV